MTKTKSTVIALVLGLIAVVAGIVPSQSFAESGSSHTSVPKVEVAITDGGKVLVRGAKVTSVSGSTVNTSVTWGTTVLNWSVSTNGSTEFLDARGKKTGALGSIVVGDTISFAGTLTGVGSTMSALATAVKDWSPIPNTNASGQVDSINSASNSLVLDKSKNKTITVQFNSNTLITMNGTTTPFSAIAVDDYLKVTGVYNTDGSVITATPVAVTKKDTVSDKRFNGLIKKWFSDKKLGNFFKNSHDD